MKIIYFKKIGSTQKYLLENINKYKLPVCVWSDYQTHGIGSRGNSWIGKRGNLFFSFAQRLDEYKDVPIESFSVYFGWLFKKTLNDVGSKAVMKWPNDIYLIDKKPKKIGGVITNIKKNHLICGIGLNTEFSPHKDFGCLDIEIKNDRILKSFFKRLKNRESFESVIESFKKEFEYTKTYFGIEGRLGKEGALIKNEKRVYSKR